MGVQLDLPECTLSTEEKVLVSGPNQFLDWLPAEDDPEVLLRLAAQRRSGRLGCLKRQSREVYIDPQSKSQLQRPYRVQERRGRLGCWRRQAKRGCISSQR